LSRNDRESGKQTIAAEAVGVKTKVDFAFMPDGPRALVQVDGSRAVSAARFSMCLASDDAVLSVPSGPQENASVQYQRRAARTAGTGRGADARMSSGAGSGLGIGCVVTANVPVGPDLVCSKRVGRTKVGASMGVIPGAYLTVRVAFAVVAEPTMFVNTAG
jgi:hypothetical protein